MRSTGATVLLTVCLCMLSPLRATSASFFPPGISWMRARTEHFTVYFPKGYENIALRAARIAESAYQRLTADLGSTVHSIHLILTDHTDFANGFAGPVPKPFAVIYLTPPADFETIGDYDDWMTTVIVHELTHVIHLEDAHGVYRFFRSLFGRNPVFFPNLIAPDWYTEGLATLEETRYTTGGRACSAETRTILMADVAQPHPTAIESASIARVDWPGALTPYHMGSAFLAHLISVTENPDRGWQAIQAKNRALLPFFLNGKEKKYFGDSFSRQWSAWLKNAGKEFSTHSNGSSVSKVEEVIAPGYSVRSLRWSERGLCIALQRPHEYPGIFCFEESKPRLKRVNEGIGIDWFGIDPGGTSLVLTRLERYHTFYIRSVLEVLDLESKQKILTEGNHRLIQPDINVEYQIIAVQLIPGGSRLVSIDTTKLTNDGKTWEVLAESKGGLFQQPRWSPRDQRFAVILHKPDGTSCLQIRTARGDLLHEFRCDGQRKIDPAWSPDGTVVYFASDDSGRFNLHRIHLIESTGSFFEERLISDRYELRSPTPTPGGLYALDYTTRGYRVVRISTPQWQTLNIADKRTRDPDQNCSVRQEPIQPASVEWSSPPKAYPAGPVLLPYTWFPTIEFSDGNFRPGLFVIGEHLMGYSGYSVHMFYDTGAEQVGYDLRYRFDRWYPTLFLRTARLIDPLSGERYFLENRFETFLYIPFRRFRWSAALNVGLRYQRFNLLNADRTTRGLGTQWSIPFSIGYNRALFFGKSVSPEDGFTAFIFGNFGLSEDRYRTIGADIRLYLPGLMQHHVTAIHGVYITSEGPEPEILSMGTRSSDLGPFRLFSNDDRLIQRGWLLNAEYRFPVYEIQKTYGLTPLFLHRVGFAFFYDRAHITNHPLIREIIPETPKKESLNAVGAELQLHFEWPGFMRSVVRAGVAFDPDDTQQRRYYVILDFPF